jgi:hypothetical protein
MKNTAIKLQQAEEQTGHKIPPYLFDFIVALDQPEYTFGDEEWYFWSVTDKIEIPQDNFITFHSLDFKEEWGIDGLMFGANGVGDYLLLLKDDHVQEWLPQVFIMMHETAEVKLFAENWEDLLQNGPADYFWDKKFYLKMNEDERVVRWTAEEISMTDDEIEDEDDDETGKDFFDEEYDLRNKLDDWIDDEGTEHTSEIIQGLEQLAESEEESHKIWAINKLSDIYLKGFGPLPANLEKALDYNQVAMDLGSHKAFSNRAACYFSGMGVGRDLQKALEYAVKANELSKSNMFASVLASKAGGGMYDHLVEMIEKEIRKMKK